jgi:hypothetical protein
MGGQSREGSFKLLALRLISRNDRVTYPLIFVLFGAGGKAKPLKTPKKEKKELDDDDMVFKERQKAGMESKLLLGVSPLM